MVTIDPARRLADALGLADGLGRRRRSGSTARPGDVSGGELWAMMLDTEATFDDLVRRNAGDDEQAERILANRFYRNIAGALSGTQEYMASETLLPAPRRRALRPRRRRHAAEPQRARLPRGARRARPLPRPPAVQADDAADADAACGSSDSATQPMLRAIGKVVGSDVLADAVAFFQAFAGMEGGFQPAGRGGRRAAAGRRAPGSCSSRRRATRRSRRRRGSPTSSTTRG